ncbi:MAG: hypothetical protein M0Z88_10015 [Actinomycetota bacterium]|nr:hypothetical protein [Actinomycetota bacterium]
MPSLCGLWRAKRALVAVRADQEGRTGRPYTVALDDDARYDLLLRIEATDGLDFELVVTDALARGDPTARFALSRGVTVWLAPAPWVDALRALAGFTAGPPARSAALLARLPLVPPFRAKLKRLPPDDPRQLELP